RTALKARVATSRRRRRMKHVSNMPEPWAEAKENVQELEQALDQELNLLPDRYRLPIVLCDLEGRTRRAVARQLGLPDGTLSNRLATGRQMLRKRLARRGITVAGAVASLLLPSAAPACVPPALLLATAKPAKLVGEGCAATSVVSVHIAALIKGELKTM